MIVESPYLSLSLSLRVVLATYSVFIYQKATYCKVSIISQKKKKEKTVEIAQTVATQPRQLHYSNNLSKKKQTKKLYRAAPIVYGEPRGTEVWGTRLLWPYLSLLCVFSPIAWTYLA